MEPDSPGFRGDEGMSMKEMSHRLPAALALVLLLPALAACKVRPEGIPVGIQGYNHTDTSIPSFQINGGSGGSARRHSASGKVCCAVLPYRWSPDLEVEISWTTDLKNYQKVTVPIPKYDEAGNLGVHFLRNGEVKVFSTIMILGHPDYPLTGPEAGLREGEDPVWEHLRRAPDHKE